MMVDNKDVWLYEDFPYPRMDRASDAGEYFYAESTGERGFGVWHHSPLGGQLGVGEGHSTFIGSAEYKVTRGTWQIKTQERAGYFPRARHDIPEPPSGPEALEAILALAHQQNPRTADLPVYLSTLWPAPAAGEQPADADEEKGR